MTAEYETHPSFGMIGAYRTSIGPRGKSLFDSDILHNHTVVVRIQTAQRKRDISKDWISSDRELIEIEMSEAQWASFVFSMNTSGVPCTLQRVQGERIEQPPHAPRLQHSFDETRAAADRAFAGIREAMNVYMELPNTPAGPKREALSTLQAKINNAVPNVDYAGRVLAEHAENVVQKARADVEAMVVQRAAHLGLDVGTVELPALNMGGDES